jgi:hypothetical protein
MKFYNKSMEGTAMQQQQQMPPMQQLMNAPQQPATQNFSEKDTQLVNDILHGLNEQNQESQNNNNNAMYQHQTDADANVMRQGLPPPTQEQIQEMNEINQQNQIQNNNHMDMQNIEEELMVNSTSKNIGISNDNNEQSSTSIFDNIKDSIVVLFLVFIFMMLPINKLMVKIPSTIDTFGNATMIGNLLKALVAGVLYFVYVRYLK